VRIAVAGATGLVGKQLVAAARDAGHDVLELSRARGIDLTDGSGLDLTGVDAVIDVTNSPGIEEALATDFFVTAARTLGAAATAAGTRRTVVLSIIGVDITPDDGYYVAKHAHEWATIESAPGPVVVRAAQFHDFPGQVLGWRRDGDRASIPGQTIQPVELGEVVKLLLEVATADDPPAMIEIAGPQQEWMPDLVSQLDDAVVVTAAPVSEAVRGGALLPGPDARIVGTDFATWLGR
jgi:uncharacterized protein YbjT (DUF2867 family)